MPDNTTTPSVTTHWTEALVRLNACTFAVQWAHGYDSLAVAWAACERGDWMLWLAGRLAGPPGDASRRPLVRAACACARLSLPHVPAGELRPLRAIETAEAWTRGEATLKEVRAAAYAAAYAAYAADAAYAAYAADAAYAAYAADAAYAAYAADAAYAAADAADAAADAAAYAADAAAAAAYAAARATTLRQCADLVRQHYPTPPVLP